MNSFDLSRRRLLEGALRAAAGATCSRATLGLLGTLGAAANANAAVTDYRALVCLFMLGGNDGLGTLIPRDTAGYGLYSKPRGQLAVASSAMLPLAPATGEMVGLHPNLPKLKAIFDQGRAAFLANTGVLLQPTTRADYLANRNLPPALFSHNDQQDHWMTGAADRPKRTGWAGRIGDLLAAQNTGATLPMNLSVNAGNLMQNGVDQLPYILNADGVEVLYGLHNNSGRTTSYNEQLNAALANGHPLRQTLARLGQNTIRTSESASAAIASAPALATVFPASNLGTQLRAVARTIAARSPLNARRQIFFVGIGGFDSHDNQISAQNARLSEVDAAVSAFYNATVEMGVSAQTTLFTMSDFGRTLTSNGDGTDHGWGSHHFVVGGSVLGGRLYGRMPNLTLDGPDDAGFGRIIPTTSTDQYGATLARWFGVSDADLPTVFPNVGRFASNNLGFLSA